MFTKTVLTPEDLQGLLAGIFEYNRKGPVIGLAFFSPEGQPVTLGWCEAVCDEKGLAVRVAPEPSSDELARQLNPAVADPRKVPPAAGVAELNAFGERP